jgi:hypothetical protein
MFSAFSDLGIRAEGVVYSDDAVDSVRRQLLGLDGVLVWVNPIQDGLDRAGLDSLLREAADAGTWVSAHPDVILRMATKRVLVDLASMSWSADTHLYSSHDQFREELPGRLANGPLVLKQHRGMGGEGVWKVELDEGAGVRVQHACGDGIPEQLPIDAFVERCASYFDDGGLMVEQPFQPRLPEGMIRAYLSQNRVVGFAHQYPRGLLPPGSSPPPGKQFEPPTAPRYHVLRERTETEWVPELQRILGIETKALPVIWDADFLYGPRTASGEDAFVLCEINASSTFAFPEFAMPTVARAALDLMARER